jgi:hypothetical protein
MVLRSCQLAHQWPAAFLSHDAETLDSITSMLSSLRLPMISGRQEQSLAIAAYPGDPVTQEVALYPASHAAVSLYSRY